MDATDSTLRRAFVECIWAWDPLAVSDSRAETPDEYDDLAGFAVATARSHPRETSARVLASFVAENYLGESIGQPLVDGAQRALDCIRELDGR